MKHSVACNKKKYCAQQKLFQCRLKKLVCSHLFASLTTTLKNEHMSSFLLRWGAAVPAGPPRDFNRSTSFNITSFATCMNKHDFLSYKVILSLECLLRTQINIQTTIFQHLMSTPLLNEDFSQPSVSVVNRLFKMLFSLFNPTANHEIKNRVLLKKMHNKYIWAHSIILYCLAI